MKIVAMQKTLRWQQRAQQATEPLEFTQLQLSGWGSHRLIYPDELAKRLLQKELVPTGGEEHVLFVFPVCLQAYKGFL